jgi:hypothetical protein
MDIDDLDNDDSETTTTKKKRGKRQIYYSCSQIVNGEIVHELIPITTPPEGEDLDLAKTKQEAIKIFADKYGTKPIIIEDPVYKRIGIPQQYKKKAAVSKAVAISKTAKITTKRGTAIYNYKGVDLKVTVNYTDQPETVFAIFQGPVNPQDKIKPTQIGDWLKISDLRDVKEL